MLDFKSDMVPIFSSIATGCTINNSASVEYKDGDFKRIGEPTDAALKVFAEKLCGDSTDPKNAFGFDTKMKQTVQKIATLDFSSDRKAMSTIITGYRNDKDLLLKGAPDRILAKCTGFMTLNGLS
jgi:magnesium-transporting ATPase (P-type)